MASDIQARRGAVGVGNQILDEIPPGFAAIWIDVIEVVVGETIDHRNVDLLDHTVELLVSIRPLSRRLVRHRGDSASSAAGRDKDSTMIAGDLSLNFEIMRVNRSE